METELHISSRFKQLLKPLAADEQKQLEENIVADGEVLDPILYWNDGKRNLIVDGMHRYAIASKKQIPFRTKELKFPSADDAEIWIYDHALGRRHLLSTQEVRRLRGELYNRLKRKDGGHGDQKSGGQNVPPILNAAANVAEKAGVDEKTVKRDGKFVEALDKLASPIRKLIDEGKVKVTDEQVHALAKADPAKQGEVARAIRTGSKVSDAMDKAGLKVPKKSKPKAEGYKPRHSESVQDDTNKCPNCGCTWWRPVKGGHDCDKCNQPLGEPVGDTDETEPELGDLEQAELSQGAEKGLKKARSALGVLVRYCDEMKLAAKAKPHLEALAKLIGK